jgi:hypothetical protein
VAIEFEKRRLWMIHRIDPNVDAEREFIARNLMQTHPVTQEKYLSSPAPVFQAQTASGETYHSDGRMLLLDFSQIPAPMVAGIRATDHAPEGPLLSFSQRKPTARRFLRWSSK